MNYINSSSFNFRKLFRVISALSVIHTITSVSAAPGYEANNVYHTKAHVQTPSYSVAKHTSKNYYNNNRYRNNEYHHIGNGYSENKNHHHRVTKTVTKTINHNVRKTRYINVYKTKTIYKTDCVPSNVYHKKRDQYDVKYNDRDDYHRKNNVYKENERINYDYKDHGRINNVYRNDHRGIINEYKDTGRFDRNDYKSVSNTSKNSFNSFPTKIVIGSFGVSPNHVKVDDFDDDCDDIADYKINHNVNKYNVNHYDNKHHDKFSNKHVGGWCREGSYACVGVNNSKFLQCLHGKFIEMPCGPGTVCTPNGNESIVCGWPSHFK
ncbi:hypothetical protein AYI70_g2005 [Smittium culicis]|uniref:Carbohydrate-binding module family 19 domain-containing protein n=1 Tax=Smittium culicis TaxID=133412 RepID=A0A1R1YA45_9FUNG|nr:hypothetical protein AYI70_g2005 [Smittium culicis]